MRRLLFALIAVALVGGAGYAVYDQFFRGTPAPESPQFTPITHVASENEFEKLAKEDAVAMLGQCLSRYTREVTGGVHFTLEKQERVQGRPKPPEMPPTEVIDVWVRGDVPDPATKKTAIEVQMKWKEGAKKPLGFGAEIRGTLFSEKPKSEGGLDGKVIAWRPGAGALMDPAVVKTIHDAFRKTLEDPNVVATFDKYDQTVIYMDTPTYTKWARETFEAEKATINRLGLAAKT